MEYLKLFENHSQYADFIETEDFVRPNVSHCIEENDVHYNKLPAYVTLEITVPDDDTLVWFFSSHNSNIAYVEVNNVKIQMTDSFQADDDFIFYGATLNAGEYTVKYYLTNETFLGYMGGYSYADGGGTYICRLTNTITVPETVEVIADNALNNWYDNSSININYYNLKQVGQYSFGCQFFDLSQEIKDYVTSICTSEYGPAYCK